MGPRSELVPQRSAISLASREVPDEPVLLAGEPARDERRLDRGRPGKHGHGDTRRERGGDDPRAGVVHPGQPGIGDERHPLACDEARHELGDPTRLVVLVVGEKPRPNPVALEQDARVARVLAEHRLRRRELVEHA